MADVVKAARDHGACGVWANVLHLRPGTREHYLDKLARDWPELLPMYERLYASRAYLPDSDVRPVRQRVRDLARQFEIADRRVVSLAPDLSQAITREAGEQLSWIVSAQAQAMERRPRRAA
jgi:hypothetical protein